MSGSQMRAATLVADPAGDADREPEIEVGVQLLGVAGEAMRDAAPLRGVLAQDREEVLVRVALMQEHRLVERCVRARAGGETPPAAPPRGEKLRK